MVEEDEKLWMKRIQWSHSGYRKDDERVNALASLWIEGTLTPHEFTGEIYAACQHHIGRVPPPKPGHQPDFADYVKTVRLTAHWLVLTKVVEFCTRHKEWNTPQRRREAMQLMDYALGVSAADREKSNQNLGLWINRVRHSPAGQDILDRQLSEISTRWAKGAADYDEFKQALKAITHAANAHHTESSPAKDVFSIWSESLRLGIKGMTQRVVADYCQAQGWTDAEHRSHALELMEQALDKPVTLSPGHRGR